MSAEREGTAKAGEGAGTDDEPADASSKLLPPLLVEGLKVGSFLYVVGCVVVVIHTARLGIPVLEPVRIQNILAGLPVGLVLVLVGFAWRRLFKPIDADAAVSAVILAVVWLAGDAFAGWCLAYLMRDQSIAAMACWIPTVVAVLNIGLIVVAATGAPRASVRLRAVARSVAWLLMTGLAVVAASAWYAVELYPRLPQSLGGGDKAQAILCTAVEAGAPSRSSELCGPGSEPSATVDVYLRTGDYLVFRSAPRQPLVQLRMEGIRRIVWLASADE